MNEARRLRFGLGRQVADLVDREDVAERVAAPVHHQRPLGVDHQAPIPEGLHTPRMWFDVDNVGGYRRREPPGRIAAERTTSGHQSHGVTFLTAPSVDLLSAYHDIA